MDGAMGCIKSKPIQDQPNARNSFFGLVVVYTCYILIQNVKETLLFGHMMSSQC